MSHWGTRQTNVLCSSQAQLLHSPTAAKMSEPAPVTLQQVEDRLGTLRTDATVQPSRCWHARLLASRSMLHDYSTVLRGDHLAELQSQTAQLAEKNAGAADCTCCHCH